MYGPHLIMEGYDVPEVTLKDMSNIYHMLDEFPAKIGMTKIMPPHVQQYMDPADSTWGISGFVIIAESHIAIHTYPAKNFFALDIFSCKDFDVDAALEFARLKLGVPRYDHKLLFRGEDYPKDIRESCRIVGHDRDNFKIVASAVR